MPNAHPPARQKPGHCCFKEQILDEKNNNVFNNFNGYVATAGVFQAMALKTVQPSIKSSSKSVTVDGSGQGASQWMRLRNRANRTDLTLLMLTMMAMPMSTPM